MIPVKGWLYDSNCCDHERKLHTFQRMSRELCKRWRNEGL
ncbi:hypothetical protein T03_12657 [Trichinella britovi]|uniref:Uncharacterized protein n=1 Tax=Trichinella britovi TaxID=45882 RepID=A0A0V1C5Q1_TRIBR|nr:hypothetical protein T03_2824 [Trichinella britovi]KRY44326.1 hypothetical protein T03_12657 [Trichinella britovi]